MYKRYERYKDTGIEWIGEVPEHWNILPNKVLFSERNERKGNHKFELLSVTQINGIIKQEEITIKKDISSLDKSNYKIVRINDLAYNKMRMWQGALGHSGYEGIVSPAYVVLTPESIANSKYYQYLFKSPNMIFSFQLESYGICDDQNSLRYKNFKNIYSIHPPMKEQKAIASYLDCKTSEIDSLIADKENLIEKLKEYKQSLITEAVTKGLNPNVNMKDSGIEWIGGVPEHWEVVSLKKVFKIINGGTPKSNVPNYWENGDLAWVTPDDLSNTDGVFLIDSNRRITKDGLNNSSASMVPANSIIVSTRAPIGYVKIAGLPLSTNQGCKSLVKRDDNLCEIYYYYLIKSAEKHLNMLGQGTTFTELSSTNLSNVKLLIPTIDEQNEISNYIQSKSCEVEVLIKYADTSVQKLKSYRQSLIYEAVTGKIDVRDYQLERSEQFA